MREKDIEQHLKNRIEGLGGLCWKFTSPGTTGVPDRICILNGLVFFVEVKNETGQLRSVQSHRIGQLWKQGMHVRVVHSVDEVDGVVNEMIYHDYT